MVPISHYCAHSLFISCLIISLQSDSLTSTPSRSSFILFFKQVASSFSLSCDCCFIMGFHIHNYRCSMGQEDSQVKDHNWHIMKYLSSKEQTTKVTRISRLHLNRSGLQRKILVIQTTISVFCLITFLEETLVITHVLEIPTFSVSWVSWWDIQLEPVAKKPVRPSGLYIVDLYEWVDFFLFLWS